MKQKVLLGKRLIEWYLLWKAQGRLPATAAIKDGNEQAKATDGNEMPLWNPFVVFRN